MPWFCGLPALRLGGRATRRTGTTVRRGLVCSRGPIPLQRPGSQTGFASQRGAMALWQAAHKESPFNCPTKSVDLYHRRRVYDSVPEIPAMAFADVQRAVSNYTRSPSTVIRRCHFCIDGFDMVDHEILLLETWHTGTVPVYRTVRYRT